MKKILILTLMSLAFAYAESFLLVEKVGEYWQPYCSGFVVDGVAITAAHCFTEGTKVLKAYAEDNKGNVYLVNVQFLKLDGEFDYAILDGSIASLIDSFTLSDDLTPGETIYYEGNIGGFGIFRDDGIYYGIIQPSGSVPVDYHGDGIGELNIAKGSSGGAVLNSKGEAVGILIAQPPLALEYGGNIYQPPQVGIFKNLKAALGDYKNY